MIPKMTIAVILLAIFSISTSFASEHLVSPRFHQVSGCHITGLGIRLNNLKKPRVVLIHFNDEEIEAQYWNTHFRPLNEYTLFLSISRESLQGIQQSECLSINKVSVLY
ncbi:hypothetical protein A9Q84_16815 [Halobacteriovorax marinus]|uniref:Secreted protein n=1 Tax=Halobacteriovorax marinus TaxID=97084 RepID=A0A1Y5F4V5_9BACT|nr:hypothetical protein A9Q84_16815 [Halobacteriovorax marinus]